MQDPFRRWDWQFNQKDYNKTQEIMRELLYYMSRSWVKTAQLDRFTLFMPDLERKTMEILSDRVGV